MKYTLSFLFLLMCNAALAQFKTIKIGVNGLTCSQCSRSVEMQLRKLSFVSDVKMDLKNTEGVIKLSPKEKTDIRQVATAITNSGFSVRYVQAVFDASGISKKEKNCFVFKGDTYVLAEDTFPENSTLNLLFVNPQFLPKSEYKKYAKSIAAAQNECSKAKPYYVKLLP